MSGSECSRAGARYKAGQALFMLLCASASRRAMASFSLMAAAQTSSCTSAPSRKPATRAWLKARG